MSLNLYASNRMENLLGALSDVLSVPLASPFTPELIVVQSSGMQRWLSMGLAQRFGVWANCSYPFPNSFVTQLMNRALPEHAAGTPFSPPVTAWRIFSLLPRMLKDKRFTPLRYYLSDDGDDLKRFQISRKIADVFDQYTICRADMLKSWEARIPADETEAWQALLWRELSTAGNGLHRGILQEQFCRFLETEGGSGFALPERVSVFGISYLPAYHLQIISALGRHTEVNLFLLSPTREYWGDIVSARRWAGLTAEERELSSEGNPLLASLGKLGRDFSTLLLDLGPVEVREADLYEEPAGGSLLQRLQADILNLAGAEEERVKQTVSPDDSSVRIHSCHSPLREVEVLYDQLLSLLEQDPGLEPRDILVMTPDIETYAPYITAVFEGVRDQRKRIPFSIADRLLTSEGDIASALIKILGLPGSRLTAVQLLDLISLVPVRRCFGLSEDDLLLIRDWLDETRIRWGRDEEDRIRFGVPPYRSHSWRAGLDRLFLGYAMSDRKGELFHEILPFDDMEGPSAELLGRFADFFAQVSRTVDELESPSHLGEWGERLRNLLAEFIDADDDQAHELAAVSGIADELASLEEQSSYRGPVSFAVFRSWLTSRLEQEQKGFGFMTGGVTFCAMLPMRSIPFRVIAMIGVNDGAFPRQSSPSGFDLTARTWRPGDRSLRDEDRYLFLETLLSARDCLSISYVGQSMKDNSEIPPSVLVSELLDAISRGFTTEGGSSPEKLLITRHRLQAFSREYFSGESPLFSYSEENCAALIEKSGGVPHEVRFMPVPMAQPSVEWLDLSLTRLLRFISSPARFFVENRLGIRLEDGGNALEEREPFEMDALASYLLKTEIVDAVLRGEEPASVLPRMRSRGVLPPTRHGERLFADCAAEAVQFARKVSDTVDGSAEVPSLDLELQIEGFRLSGRLGGIRSDRMVRYRCAKLKARDLVKCWVEHLLLGAGQTAGYPQETLLIMADKAVSFCPVDDPRSILRSILDLYREGLTRPLPFFPESALACAANGAWDPERARSKWDDSYNGLPGEGRDPYFRLCFGKADPFDDDFMRVTRILLEPMLLHKEE